MRRIFPEWNDVELQCHAAIMTLPLTEITRAHVARLSRSLDVEMDSRRIARRGTATI